jgi:hypothetical protein
MTTGILGYFCSCLEKRLIPPKPPAATAIGAVYEVINSTKNPWREKGVLYMSTSQTFDIQGFAEIPSPPPTPQNKIVSTYH